MPDIIDNYQKENKKYLIKSVLRVAVVVLFVCLIAVPTMQSVMDTRERSLILASSKAVTLAAKSVILEYYGTNQIFADQTQPYGIMPEAADAMRNLSGCVGDFYLLRWDPLQHRVMHSLYIEDGYAVVYTVDEEGTQMWQIYQVEMK